MRLTIFYDGGCPLCMAEMRQLQASDRDGKLVFVNLHDVDFSERYPHIDPVRADRLLHGQLESGELLHGLDVTCLAWSLVGKHKWLSVLRWPILRPLSDLAYRLFARYRHGISRLLTGRPRCTSCTLPDR
jgi:predicted DCC family thiol-disulfide oxidoreductase YuxK